MPSGSSTVPRRSAVPGRPRSEARRSIGLLIAAGRGRRFDPSGRTSKLEALIDGEAVAVRAARALMASCDAVIAVVRPDQTLLADLLAAAGCRIATVPQDVLGTAREGMGTSIAWAARSASMDPEVDQVLVLPADMPWVRAATIRRIAMADADGHAIVLPVHGDEDGHPVRFDAALLPALAALAGDRGARGVLAANPPLRIPVDDPGVRRDVDVPADVDRRNDSDRPTGFNTSDDVPPSDDAAPLIAPRPSPGLPDSATD